MTTSLSATLLCGEDEGLDKVVAAVLGRDVQAAELDAAPAQLDEWVGARVEQRRGRGHLRRGQCPPTQQHAARRKAMVKRVVHVRSGTAVAVGTRGRTSSQANQEHGTAEQHVPNNGLVSVRAEAV